jgi:hypothetical protein
LLKKTEFIEDLPKETKPLSVAIADLYGNFYSGDEVDISLDLKDVKLKISHVSP